MYILGDLFFFYLGDTNPKQSSVASCGVVSVWPIHLCLLLFICSAVDICIFIFHKFSFAIGFDHFMLIFSVGNFWCTLVDDFHCSFPSFVSID